MACRLTGLSRSAYRRTLKADTVADPDAALAYLGPDLLAHLDEDEDLQQREQQQADSAQGVGARTPRTGAAQAFFPPFCGWSGACPAG